MLEEPTFALNRFACSTRTTQTLNNQALIDTWAETYNTGHQGIRITGNAGRPRINTQWDPRNYETANTPRPFYETIIHGGQPSRLQAPDYDITGSQPKIYLDNSADYPTYERDGTLAQDPWGFEEA